MKLKSYLACATLVASALLMQGCVSGQADMQRISDAINGRQEYEGTMRRFLIRGRFGDLDGMLALTSKITIKLAGGEGKKRELFKSELIPALTRFRNLAPGGSSIPGKDEYGHPAWSFKETMVADDGKELKMEFTVTREDNELTGEIGQLVVAYFGPWR